MRGKNKISRIGIIGSLDVARRGLVVAIWMRVVDTEEFESNFANLAHDAKQLFGRNFVGRRSLLGSILRRESVRHHSATPGEQPTAFVIWILSRVTQKLSSDVSHKSNFVHRAMLPWMTFLY